MSGTTFPSTSSYTFDLPEHRYDVDQLVKGVDAAMASKGKGKDNAATPSSATLFHLHTCTIESSLQVPSAEVYYWGRGAQPNPAFQLYTSLRSKLTENLDQLSTLDIASANDIVRPNYTPPAHMAQSGPYSQGIKVHLPGTHKKKQLAVLESLPRSVNKEWIPSSTAWDMQNWLHALLSLDPKWEPMRKGGYRDDKRRFDLQSNLKICWVPDDSDDGLDIKLLLTINVMMDLNTIFDPLPEIGHDMLGLILHSLIPSSTARTFRRELEARAAALNSFYTCLRPAPDLPFNFSANQLQPKEMVSKLLPFQTRTVRLLLQREQGTFQRGGHDPEGFWKAYDIGQKDGRVAYRRLTGDLKLVGGSRQAVKVDRKGKGRAIDASPERAIDELTHAEEGGVPNLLDLSGVRGTMLCEEMGLGKTVEAIALVLLHRHPLSKPRASGSKSTKSKTANNKRATKGKDGEGDSVPIIDLLNGTPGMDIAEVKKWVEDEQAAFAGRKAWDEQAQLNVTEVATTLIVTPPSLLKQWVSEMQRHAPTLRVCVYEGWKSLQKGVEKQRAARMKVVEVEKKRKAVAFRDQTRSKYAKSNASRRVKVENDRDPIEIDDDDEVKPELQEEEEGTLQVTQRQFVEYVRAHDVVVTTYQDLQQDLKVALPAPPRSRRSTANYRPNERPRSPLVMVEWWRVIMDEVQLAGDQSDAANMVSLIPRKNSLAVSGTPARADIKDLMGSLKFLRVPLVPYDHRIWHRLQQPSMRSAFEGLFRSIAVRTTKKEVSGEFNLPHQTRFVVPIELSEIELHYYNDTLERFRERLRLPLYPGEPRPDDWVLDRHLFIVCLRNLRQICTHIQVGQMGENVAPRGERRLHLGRALMTMTEALDKMRNDHTQEFLLDTREQMRKMIKKAQLVILNENDDVRYLTALNMYEKVRTTLNKHITPVREHLKGLLDGREDSAELDRGDTPERHQSQQEREKAQAIMTAKQTIREILIVLHQAWFFEGDVRHMLKQQDEEINCYAQADLIRKEILKQPLKGANLSVEYLQRQLGHTAAVHDVNELKTGATNNRGGILSNDIINQLNDLLEIMNDNAYLIFDWRAKIIALLSSPIEGENVENAEAGQNTEVEDPEQEFYAEALKAQGEVEAYLMAFAAAIADRKEFLLENRSTLAELDARQKKQRNTKAAMNALADSELKDVPDEVHEQAALLMRERQAFRDARVEKGCERPLKGLLIDLHGVAHGPNRHEEVLIAQRMGSMLKGYIQKQTEYVEKLNKELDLFQATFNRRVKYFAALQEISDSVTAPEYKDLTREIDAYTREIDELEVKLARMVVKGRYLQYLGNKERDHEDIREDCIICFGSSDDTQAVLLECGHYFCSSCYKEYRKSPMGRKCPSCRMDIDGKDVTRIKLNSHKPAITTSTSNVDEGMKVEEGEGEVGASVQVPEPQDLTDERIEEIERERRAADLRRLKMMDMGKMREVMGMDMLGEYGSKINFLIKHLLYFKSREPDARHVIFSNWSDSLNIVMQALRANDIKFTSFDEGKKRKDVVDKFVKDQSIKVFLLHAEKESSGLTLTSCRVVHLLEPVLRHSFELQAIGRVDRLGQDKETSVYCYATLETVESRILSQGVRNGTSIYLDEANGDEHVADMPNVASAASKGGDVAGDGNEEDLLGLIM
uniref:E3 ubiquitin-protein ligase SHPRH n=1 Tax=Kwoniella bestiolae CBS 10118 TaxID=1296100 RepID=A0A1B9G5U0_9TREE|nr:E3 ubiquitin-protein ligase SHPRH [Kwoniella bestiolae CBS 10118]OCF26368.1 E3 ubiquitin-protein ligase SHPRH [Kwoniella bestiolae CBS 10118]